MYPKYPRVVGEERCTTENAALTTRWPRYRSMLRLPSAHATVYIIAHAPASRQIFFLVRTLIVVLEQGGKVQCETSHRLSIIGHHLSSVL